MVSTSSPDDPPLSLEPIVGWRVWRLRRQDGTLTLVSVMRDDPWPTDKAMEAKCASHRGAAVPGDPCACGLYAASSPQHLARAGVFTPSVCVVGAVAMWGRVVEHARGARTRFAYPARLRLVCGTCLSTGAGAVDAVGVRGSDGPLIAACKRHGEGVGEPWLPAAPIQAELLATYHVDPMPLQRISRSLRTGPWPASTRWAQPLKTPAHILAQIVHAILTGLFMAWAFSGFILLALAIVVGIVQAALQGLGLSHPAEPPPLVLAQPPRSSPFVIPPIDDLPYRGGPVPAPAPLPPLAFVCGVGQGDHVDIVRCSDPSDLFGIAALTTPTGPRHDCFGPWDAYSSRHRYWICWTINGQAWVHPRPRAPNPWSVPVREGGEFHEHRRAQARP